MAEIVPSVETRANKRDLLAGGSTASVGTRVFGADSNSVSSPFLSASRRTPVAPLPVAQDSFQRKSITILHYTLFYIFTHPFL